MTREEILQELYSNIQVMMKKGIDCVPYEQWKVNMSTLSDNDLLKVLGKTREVIKSTI